MGEKRGVAIVITSGKGGVGKTTTSANVGTALAMAGKSVVLIDADIGLRNLDVVLGLENRIVFDIVDVVEKTCKISKALIKDKRFGDLYLLPAAQTRDKSAVSPEQMKGVVESLKSRYDYIIIDSPAGIEQGFQYSIAGADRAIVVTTPEVSAVRDADRVIGLLEAHGLENPTLIVNRVRVDMVKSGDMMDVEDVKDVLAIDLIGIIPDEQSIIISTNRGEPVVKNENTIASKSYKNIAERIQGKETPFLDLNVTENKFMKIFKIIFNK